MKGGCKISCELASIIDNREVISCMRCCDETYNCGQQPAQTEQQQHCLECMNFPYIYIEFSDETYLRFRACFKDECQATICGRGCVVCNFTHYDSEGNVLYDSCDE